MLCNGLFHAVFHVAKDLALGAVHGILEEPQRADAATIGHARPAQLGHGAATVGAAAKAEKAPKAERTAKKTEQPRADEPTPPVEEEAPVSAITPLEEIKRDIADLCLEMQDDDGWTMASIIGDQLRKRHPEFDTKNYGSKKPLTAFLRALGTYEISKKDANAVIRPKK